MQNHHAQPPGQDAGETQVAQTKRQPLHSNMRGNRQQRFVMAIQSHLFGRPILVGWRTGAVSTVNARESGRLPVAKIAAQRAVSHEVRPRRRHQDRCIRASPLRWRMMCMTVAAEKNQRRVNVVERQQVGLSIEPR
jgi:hypothetical protein